MKRVLVIDGMNMAYAAYHAYKKLENGGKPVSIIYGLPSIIAGLINNLSPNDIHLVWDGKKSIERLSVLPTYKHGRRTMTETERAIFYKQIATVKRLLNYLGVKQYYNEAVEGDDLIYLLARKLKLSYKVIIVSSDKDFHQLISYNIRVYAKSREVLLHHKNLESHYGYKPEHAKDWLILTGDKSDNIPKYPGIGPAKAQKFFAEFSSIKEYLNSKKTISYLNKEKLAILYKQNRQLIDLKYHANKYLLNVSLEPINPDTKIKKNNLIKLCNKYNITTFVKKDFIKKFKLS